MNNKGLKNRFGGDSEKHVAQDRIQIASGVSTGPAFRARAGEHLVEVVDCVRVVLARELLEALERCTQDAHVRTSWRQDIAALKPRAHCGVHTGVTGRAGLGSIERPAIEVPEQRRVCGWRIRSWGAGGRARAPRWRRRVRPHRGQAWSQSARSTPPCCSRARV